jgi:hypothetical protein
VIGAERLVELRNRFARFRIGLFHVAQARMDAR